MLRDPVCGQRVHRGRSYARVEHEHYTYYLCCPRCQAEFEAKPDEYARPAYGERISRPVSAKALRQQPNRN